ncbi:MAG: GFA family protein [Myxococcota bacterium]
MPSPTAPETWLEGGCHCGAVRFRARGARRALQCNCSICAKKGFLGWIVPAEDFDLLAGEPELATYRFQTKQAQHRFCRHCGIHPFSRPRSHPGHFDVNLRCLDDGFEGFEITPFDGQHWEENVARIGGGEA